MARVWLAAVGVALSGCAGTKEPDTLGRARELMAGAKQPHGDLALRCEPPDAEVYLDGVLQGVCTDFPGTPRALRVGEGLHQIEVKMRGFWPYTTYYDPSGARASLNIQLRPVPPSGEGTP